MNAVDVILALDDVTAGVACFGVPLRDGHGIEEVAPGVLADGSHLEWSVAEMFARQARRIRGYARFVLDPDPDREPIADPAARADEYRADAARVLERGPSMMGHRVASDDERAWHREALARVGVRFKAELLRRLDPDAVDAWCADDIADVVHAQADERREIAEEFKRLHARVTELDALRKAAHVPADLAYVRRCVEQNTVESWGRVGLIAARWHVPSRPGESALYWLRRIIEALDGTAAT